MQRRRIRGPARYYVAALVAVLIAVGLFVVARNVGQPTSAALPTPGPASPPGAESPLQLALDGIRDDGTWSKDTALAAFAAAFGPLPDVPIPPADSSYHSGSAALQMVRAIWSELTDAQRQAVRDRLGPAAPDVVPAVYRGPALDTYQTMAEQAATNIAAKLGRPLGIPIKVYLSPVEHNLDWAWATGVWYQDPPEPLPHQCFVSIPPSTVNDPSRAPMLPWLITHEMFHCFEHTLVDYKTSLTIPLWVTEGEANWVAEAITGGVGEPTPVDVDWDRYVVHPERKLYARSYDAMGFFAQLAQIGIDPWTVLDATYKAAAAGSDAAFEASGANTPTFTDRWGSSWYRDGLSNAAWAMHAGFGITPEDHRATPSSIALADGGSDSISASPLTAAIADLHTTAFVTRIEVRTGTGRVAEPRAGGLDKVVRSTMLDLCTSPGSDCTCPPGSDPIGNSPQTAPPELRLAATGEERATTVLTVQGISLSDWCRSKRTDLCNGSCGGSNGDPHMRTVDGVRYDLQAAGEYVLLRSTDGSIEIQGRQERPAVGTDTTIDTAIAVKADGHRIGFYVAPSGPPQVHVDGVAIDAATAGSTDLGTGTKLQSYQRGYELDLPDGTRLWALSAGSWGINLLVLPSDGLRASGVGLISRIPEGAGLRLPAPADGSRIPLPISRHERYHDLYEVLAPSWLVTPTTSLFDYAPGQSTASFSVPGFPPEAVPETTADLPAATLTLAQAACSGVTDADLADQCAYDVAVTGSNDYVTLYQATDELQTQGPASLDLPLPTPGSGGSGGTATGAIVVDDHITGTGGHVVGPDGTLYLSVSETSQAAAGSTAMVLAIDGATGKVNERASGADIGDLAWAAGSLWAGEFSRKDANTCEVTRLDPATLAVQASVPTTCFGHTAFAAVGDAIWFADATGADASGSGGRMRRIDPATNQVDTSPAANLAMPFVTGNFALDREGSVFESGGDALIFGDHTGGLFRFTPADGTFQPLGQPGNGGVWYPVGRGVWTQTESSIFGDAEGVASFFTGSSTPEAQVGINGMLVGADATSVYAAGIVQDLTQPQDLWRYPADRSAQQRVVTSGVITDASGAEQGLSFQDPRVPLIVTDDRVIKLWLVPSPTSAGQEELVFQSAPLP